eukprot:scaffold58200_cov25-Tisochrysis_lutea.AAC.3
MEPRPRPASKDLTTVRRAVATICEPFREVQTRTRSKPSLSSGGTSIDEKRRTICRSSLLDMEAEPPQGARPKRPQRGGLCRLNLPPADQTVPARPNVYADARQNCTDQSGHAGQSEEQHVRSKCTAVETLARLVISESIDSTSRLRAGVELFCPHRACHERSCLHLAETVLRWSANVLLPDPGMPTKTTTRSCFACRPPSQSAVPPTSLPSALCASRSPDSSSGRVARRWVLALRSMGGWGTKARARSTASHAASPRMSGRASRAAPIAVGSHATSKGRREKRDLRFPANARCERDSSYCELRGGVNACPIPSAASLD